MNGLSTIILTNKDPQEIQPTLASVTFADETIVLRDHPKHQPLNGNFAAQRNLGLKRAKNDWVLFIDDDEIVSRELAGEIATAIASDEYSGYCLRRLDRFHGTILNRGETGNIKILRLGKKGRGEWVRPVHETWKITGKVGGLNTPLIHDRNNLTQPFVNRIALYGPLDAKALTREKKPFSNFRLLINPLAKFFQNYLFRLGFLDGYLGLFHAYLMSIQSLSVRVFQWQEKS